MRRHGICASGINLKIIENKTVNTAEETATSRPWPKALPKGMAWFKRPPRAARAVEMASETRRRKQMAISMESERILCRKKAPQPAFGLGLTFQMMFR